MAIEMADHDALIDCPDPDSSPDDCAACEGWGHRCPAFRATHSAQAVADVQTVYESGWDPTRFYGSVEQAVQGGRQLARERKGH